MGNKQSNKTDLPCHLNAGRQRLVSISWQAEEYEIHWNPLYESPCDSEDADSVVGERQYSHSRSGLSDSLDTLDSSPAQRVDISDPVSIPKSGSTIHRFSFQLQETPAHIKVRLPTWKQEELEHELEKRQRRRKENLIYLENLLRSPSLSAVGSPDFSSDVRILWELLDRSFDCANSIDGKVKNDSNASNDFKVEYGNRRKTVHDFPIVDSRSNHERQMTVDDFPMSPSDSRRQTLEDRPIDIDSHRRNNVNSSPMSPVSEDEEQRYEHPKTLPRSFAILEMLLEGNLTPRAREPSAGKIDFGVSHHDDGEVLISESISPYSVDTKAESKHPEGFTSETEKSFVFVEEIIEHQIKRHPEDHFVENLLPKNEKRQNSSLDSVVSQDLYCAGTPEERESSLDEIVEEDGYSHFPRMRDFSRHAEASAEDRLFEGFLE